MLASVNKEYRPSWHILPFIVLAQFMGTSLWFSGNAIMPELIQNFKLPTSALAYLTSAVQLGFIVGTLVFALYSVADRFKPSKIFWLSAIFGALANGLMIWDQNSFNSLLILRFLTGFSLAGIYPVGMKIAADHYSDGLNKALGFLVGALVLGTAFPHALNSFGSYSSWKSIAIITSLLALTGGFMVGLGVPESPLRKASSKIDIRAAFKVFRNVAFRKAAIGYFGHMWELYAFWAIVPLLLKGYLLLHPTSDFSISLWSFIIIASGSLSCILGGYLSAKYGVRKTAFLSLFLSFICCLLIPLVLINATAFVFLIFMIFWGMVVIADSPLFSTLVAQNASAEVKGTALTIVNSIGFFITIISIQLIVELSSVIDSKLIFWILAIGPVLGLLYGRKSDTGEVVTP